MYIKKHCDDLGRRICFHPHYATMTINHIFLRVSASNFAATRAFYTRALAPLGYKEMIAVSSTYVGIGSDYPYLFLKALPEGQKSVPTHMAFDAPSKSLHRN